MFTENRLIYKIGKKKSYTSKSGKKFVKTKGGGWKKVSAPSPTKTTTSLTKTKLTSGGGVSAPVPTGTQNIQKPSAGPLTTYQTGEKWTSKSGVQYIKTGKNAWKKYTGEPTGVTGGEAPLGTGSIAGVTDIGIDTGLTYDPKADAQSLLEYQMGQQAGYEKELFGKSVSPKTIGEVVNQFKQQQLEEKSYAEKQAKLAGEIETSEMQRAKKAAASQVAGAQAEFAQDREGVVSATAPKAFGEFKATSQQIMNEAQKRLESSQLQRKNMLSQLEQAQKSGKSNLAAELKRQLVGAEQEIRQAQTDLLNAQSQATEVGLQVQASQRANFESFVGLIDSGVELNVPSIQQFATQLNIPFEVAYGYYDGAKNIRDDKKLDLAGKQLELQNLQRDFDERVQGIRTKEAQSVSDYLSLAQSGQYSPDQLQAFATAMNIPNENNPLYQLELALKGADAKIKLAEANGQLINPIDQIKYYSDLAQYQEMTGGTGQYYIPEKSLEGLQVSVQNGKLSITGNANAKYQCGAFVNRVWGLASGSAGGFGDSYQNKIDKITVSSSQINNLNFTNLVKPGMAFVMGAGGSASAYGHVGIVTQVFPDGTFLTAETNISGDKINSSPAVEKLRNYKDVDGFVTPPNSQLIGTGGDQGDGQQFSPQNVQKVTSTLQLLTRVSDKKQVAETITSYMNSGDTKGLQSYVTRIAMEDLPASDQTKILFRTNLVNRGNDLVSQIEAFEALGEDVGIFQGSSTAIQNKIGKMDNPQAQAIAQSIRLMLEDFGRAQTGAAIQDFEKKAFKDIFPSMYDGSSLAKIKIDSFANALQSDAQSTLKFKLGEDVYGIVFPPQPQEQPFSLLQTIQQNYFPEIGATDIWNKYTDPINDLYDKYTQ